MMSGLDQSFRNFVPPSRIYNTFKIWSKISNLGFMAQLRGSVKPLILCETLGRKSELFSDFQKRHT